MHSQFAEAPAKIHQVVGGYVLIAEDDQLVLDQRGLDRLELGIRQRLPQVDTGDLGAEMHTGFPHGDSGVFGGERFALVKGERLVHGTISLGFE